jgi:hypothetical protein
MVSVRWREKRRPHWERLEQLVHRAHKSLAALNSRELQELGLLYRQTASDLSVVLEDKTSVQLAAYLNQLLGRSHNLLYMGRSPKASRIWFFYSQTYPRLFRETWRSTLLATVVFAAAAIAGWVVTLHDPAFAHRILGPEMMDTIERRQMWTHSVVAMKPVAASGITTNNLTVSFTIFALGITGIGTLWMLIFNGLLLGVVGAATRSPSSSTSFRSGIDTKIRCCAWRRSSAAASTTAIARTAANFVIVFSVWRFMPCWIAGRAPQCKLLILRILSSLVRVSPLTHCV